MNISFRTADILDRLYPTYTLYVTDEGINQLRSHFRVNVDILNGEDTAGLMNTLIEDMNFDRNNDKSSVARLSWSTTMYGTSSITSHLETMVEKYKTFISGFLGQKYKVQFSRASDGSYIFETSEKVD